jgi:hypothetical protein
MPVSDELLLPNPANQQYDPSMDARVAVLEEIAKNTAKVLERMDSRLERLEDRQNSDFRWLLGFGIGGTGFLFATMAHGFHWL